MKKLILILVFLLAAFSSVRAGEDYPPTGNGNLWIINVPFCTDLDDLVQQAVNYCGVYRQTPIEISHKLGCWKWYVGIAGPYAKPGAYDLQFRCY